MAQSPSHDHADPMVGKAGVGESNAPEQQTDAQQRPGMFYVPFPDSVDCPLDDAAY